MGQMISLEHFPVPKATVIYYSRTLKTSTLIFIRTEYNKGRSTTARFGPINSISSIYDRTIIADTIETNKPMKELLSI